MWMIVPYLQNPCDGQRMDQSAGEMLALLGVNLPLTAPTIMPSRSPCCFSNRPETEALWKSSQRSPNTSTNESEGEPGSQYFLKMLSMSLRKLKCGQAATPSSRAQRILRKPLLSQTSEKALLGPSSCPFVWPGARNSDVQETDNTRSLHQPQRKKETPTHPQAASSRASGADVSCLVVGWSPGKGLVVGLRMLNDPARKMTRWRVLEAVPSLSRDGIVSLGWASNVQWQAFQILSIFTPLSKLRVKLRCIPWRLVLKASPALPLPKGEGVKSSAL